MISRIASLVLAAALLASCAVYTVVPAQSRVPIANGLSVQPTKAWASNTRVQEPNFRAWTMDGPMLNTLGFVPGLANGTSILVTPSGKEPMPVFRSNMAATEVAELFEATLARATAGGSLVKTMNVRPTTFAGQPGFRFDFTYVNQTDDVDRRGIAAGTIYKGQLYLIFFHAARIHYFPSNIEEVETVIKSAQIG
jgi:hypothetical protein